MTEQNNTLFNPANAGPYQLQNRIAMAPMTRSRAFGNIPNELMAEYYSQRSSAGLIITEGTAPSPEGLGYARIPGIYSEEQVEGWRGIADAVHEGGGRIFLQLMHTGRIAHPDNQPKEAQRILAPSAVPAEGQIWTDASGMQDHPTPEPMSEEDIRQVISEYTYAARNAVEAGLDGVELHATSGYLLQQFLNPHSNLRSDRYGGSVENRVRFVAEVAESVVDAVGADRTGIRISPYKAFNDVPIYDSVPETYLTLVKEMDRLGLLYVHVVEDSARDREDGPELLRELHASFGNLWMVNGGYSRESAEESLAHEEADLVAFGTPFISNPDLPERLEDEITLASPDQATFYQGGEEGYTDYAFAT